MLYPIPILNQSVVSCLVLTVVSWPTYRFFRRQVKWSDIPISLRIFHGLFWSTVKGFSIVNEAEVDVFLEFSCLFYDPTNVSNLISGSSAFSKSSLYTGKFLVHVLLNPSLKNFEHYFASMWNEYNCAVVSSFFSIAFFGLEWKLTFSSPAATAEFSKFAGIWSTALSQDHLLVFEIIQLEFHYLH